MTLLVLTSVFLEVCGGMDLENFYGAVLQGGFHDDLTDRE
jgi:hypothetical protein